MGIEPATFRLVEQCFNHLRHGVPPTPKCWHLINLYFTVILIRSTYFMVERDLLVKN